MLSQKHNAKACLANWDVGIVYCTCGHFLRDDTTENKSTSSPFLISSLFRTFTSRKVNHMVTDTERKKVIKNITLRTNSKRSVRNDNSWTFTIGSLVMHGSERPCWNWVALKKWSARWTNWRTRTTHFATEKELNVYRGNWWKRLNFVGIALISKKCCQPASRMQRIKLFLVLVASFLVASLIWDITTTMDLTLIERGNLRKTMNGLFIRGMSLKTNLVQNYSDHFGNSQRNSLSPTECVKSIPPSTENWLRKLCTYTARRTTRALRTSMTQTTSTRMTRTWTRANCTTPDHALRARSLRHTLMLGHMHLVAQVLSPVMSSMCVSP